MRLRELAGSRIRYGYRRLTVLLRREGWKVNTKRVYRLYREEQLQVRTAKRTKLAPHLRVPLPVDDDLQEHEIARLQRRISELERLTGRQTAELDFFAAALRSVKETRRKSGASSGEESTK